jgi:adenine-specific DNA-methyltransferase
MPKQMGGVMPVLDWIGKRAVINHHKDVPYRLLHCDSKLSAGEPDSGNLIVQGDNLEALNSVLAHPLGSGVKSNRCLS